ncbi:DUF3556 domain-containing protein [Nocardioides sp. Kera G14]|uniref:DUF3556 domain-containing protein n=1 Tax=Nocardioides sp. Kera G14 TaxID=2884264 RepID=UPI001D1255D7|nr:DUF3556 domain-containing protein [Nocardioides sp. Kera G14]UDY23326.1 DUF3556 domain-containing protein [Nocardioides sp. Kera G14]
MPFLNPVLPDVDPAAFNALPLRERLRIGSTFWADEGFGTPRYVHVVYILKVLVLYVALGLLVIGLTSDVGSVWHIGDWWKETVVYQKAIVWTALIEVVGIGGAWGPLCGHFKPMTGGARYWLRTGTIRVAPWRLPLTGDTRRSGVDVALYAALLLSLVAALVAPPNDGMVRPWLLALPVVLFALNGLRDSIIFLAGRGEQYVPAMILGVILGETDLIIAAKLIIVVVWIGAGCSKFGHHFVNVVPAMISNGPFTPGRTVRRLHYRNVAEGDLRPSGLAWFMAHVGGTTVEILTPLVLLFTTNRTVVVLAVILMVVFHAFITVAFPLAVPLEWNVLFGFLAVYLFVGHAAGDGWALADFSHPWALIPIAAGLVLFPVLGNLRPDLVSFLPSMRQYAGNWATSVWAYAPGAEAKLAKLGLPVEDMTTQMRDLLKYDHDTAELAMSLICSWRSMHSQGRGLYSRLLQLDDIEQRTIREGEFQVNLIRGWNFGDGHLHDERLVAAVQERIGFEPGELVVVYAESQPIHRGTQSYRVIDAALGVIERGTWRVDDAVAEQPWLPNGPIPLTVTWRPAAPVGAAPATASVAAPTVNP